MKRVILVWLLCLAPMAFAEEPKSVATFEGVVERTISTPEGSANAQYLIKGKKTRINIETKAGKQSLLVDMQARQVTKLMPEKKSYLTMEVPDIKKTDDEKGAALKKTGKTQLLLGKSCEEWIYKSSKQKVVIWAVPGLGEFMGMTNEIRQAEAWMGMVKEKNLFPVKVTSQDGTGKTVFSMEVTKMTEKAMPDDPFDIPKDYQKMDLSTLLLQGQAAEKK